MKVELLKEESEWENYIEKKPDATIYHTLGWKKVMEKFGHRPIYLICKEEGEVKGILPLFYIKGLFGKRLVSVSLRDRGGPLFDDETTVTALLKKSIELCKEKNCDYIEIKKIESSSYFSPLGFIEKQGLINTSIPLNKEVSKIWKATNKGSVRSSIRKAIKEGVVCNWSKNPRDLNQFYKLFVLTRKRLGVPPFPYSFFKEMQNNMGDNFKLMIAKYKKKIISSAIMFDYNKVLIDGYASSDDRFLTLRPNNALVWETLKWGAKNKFKVFDFGSDDVSCKGLISFKSRWGGIQQKTYSYFYLNKIKKIPESRIIESKLIKNIWQIMPTGISKMLGRYVTKQIS